MEQVWNTIDRENAEKKDEKIPVERLDGRVGFIKSRGGMFHVYLARCKGTNELVGLNEVVLYETNPAVAQQTITGVVP